jgi:hypothetical protein
MSDVRGATEEREDERLWTNLEKGNLVAMLPHV